MASIIKNRAVVDNDAWQVVQAAEDGALPEVSALPAGQVLVPLAYWLAHRDALVAAKTKDQLGVWLSPDSEPAEIAGDLDKISLIGAHFPAFSDGRGFSTAHLLRSQYGWTGELRAFGDVLRDLLFHLERCGFDSFAVRADKDIHDALKAFGEFSDVYQGSNDEPLPLYRRHRNGAGVAA
jgi:uncharacterized protein (DUF934 family)